MKKRIVVMVMVGVMSTLLIACKDTVQEHKKMGYENFLKGEERIYFNQFMPEDYEGTFFETEKGYTLNDILMELQEHYPHMSIEPQIEYAYLDCGADGIEEMALRIKGMGIYNLEDDSTIVCVIKEIEEKLECSYFYETWARSDTQLNYYGYVTSGGSNSASNHGWSESYIDKDGKWNFICYIEEEYDITAFSWNDKLSALSDVVADKQYDGTIVMTTIRFEEILDEEDYENVKRYYSYYVDGVEDDVYMDGIYSEIFEEAGVEIDQLEEIEFLIGEKEACLGVTEEIKQGEELHFIKLEIE